MNVLVTGFDAFDGAPWNPSADIAMALAAEADLPGSNVSAAVLPTIYAAASAQVLDAIERASPDLIVLFGLAASADRLRLERFALNVADSPTRDNAGIALEGTPIHADGPDAFSTRLDLRALAGLAGARGHAPVVSNYAGAFVCNYVYYTVLHRLAETGSRTDALFVHVPWSLPAPADKKTAPVDATLSAALLAAARATVAAARDLRSPSAS